MKDKLIEKLKDALNKIANPTTYLLEYAKKEGMNPDGIMIVKLANDSNWLKSEAQKSLDEISALEKQIEDKSKSADIIQKIEDYAQELMVNRDYYSRAYIIGHLVEKVKSLINT